MAFGLLAVSPLSASAQSSGDTSYQVTPDQQDSYNTPGDSNSAPPASSTEASGPVRLARFSFVDGDVSWRPTTSDDWSTADVNVPIREGAQIWVTNGGKAEIQFDDGSYVRIGDGAIVTLQTLYSDANGEFTELSLNQGLVTLDLKNQQSIYQLDTPLTSIKSSGDASVRVGVNDGVEVAVHGGSADLTGPGGSAKLEAGDYVYLSDANSYYNIEQVPGEDSWDHWNDDRDASLADDETDQYCPPNIALCAGDLTAYGDWHDDTEYGWVWCPNETDPGWRPYEQGSWVYCQPFGWTWCSSEPWGWAPYHYGTWFHSEYGWAWRPGPARQYWSPAVVSFTNYNGNVGWCPLAPSEVHYSSLDIAAGGRGFFLNFSIGQAGCYYPGPSGQCVARPFNNYNVNRYGRPGFTPRNVTINQVTNITNITNVTNIHNNFVPVNARYGGVMTASAAGFGGSHDYRPASSNSEDFFTRGQVVGAPRSGVRPFSGPVDVRPTAASWTPSRSVQSTFQPESSITSRRLFRAPLPPNVAKAAPPVAARFEEPTTPSRPFNVRTNQDGGFNSGSVPSRTWTNSQTAPVTTRQWNTPSQPSQNTPSNQAHQWTLPDRTYTPSSTSTDRTQWTTPDRMYTAPTVSTNRSQWPTPDRTNNAPSTYTNRTQWNAPVRSYSPSPVQQSAPSNHVPDWNGQGGFHVDQRNSGGGYTPRQAKPAAPTTWTKPQSNNNSSSNNTTKQSSGGTNGGNWTKN